ncbi:Lrp/AsnC family transcriptional regulator [Hellea balneolensis]|uniref:Lrp/AsnC family transcriptional regulator n=1 Tax=Hellea balneolensis TaxID=287478 RepID=UPI000409519F|nr:Lrp/AsnC family transcriptional regulator [Hellea balneolensis]
MRVTFKDQQLLSVLRGNARATTTQLAQILGLSRSTVQKRLERLETEGVIAGYTVQLTSEYLDQEIKAHVMITVSPRMTAEIISQMEKLEGIRAIYSVSGPHDLIAEVAAMSVTDLDGMIDKIIAIEGVERTVSSVILSTRLKR